MANITFEKLENYKSGSFECPVLKVNNPESNSFKKDGYLAPFRFYKFQVSGSYEGYMDLGSGEVRMFKNIIEYNHPFDAQNIMVQELVKCLNAYLQTSYGYTGKEIAFTYGGKVYNIEYYEKKNIEYDELIEIPDILLEFVVESYHCAAKYYKLDTIKRYHNL